MEKDMKIEIFGKPHCPFCDKAKFLAQASGHEWEYQQLGTDYEMSFIADNFPTARTFPQIRVDGKNIGGYTDLEAHLNGLG